MGPKKKSQSQIVPEQKMTTSTVPNKIRTVKTNDGGFFQINDALLSKYCGKLRKKIQQCKGQQVLELQDIDKVTFKYVEQFLSNRKDKQMTQIQFPMRSNLSLKYIMDQNDAVLMQKIEKQGGMQLVRRLLDAATNLQMEDMRKRLFCLVALKLSRHTVDELKQIYEIPNIETNQDTLKTEMKSHLQQLKKTADKKCEEQ